MEVNLGWRAKTLYGSGDAGFSLTLTILGAYFAIYLTDVVGLSPGIAAIAIFVGRTWDYVNDPIVGHLSDRTRSRWGRRRPFLLFGALPFAITFSLMWWRPPITGQLGLAVYYSIVYLLFDAAATVVYMPYFALTPELTSDYDERTSLTSFRMFFSILGSLIAFTVPLLIIGSFAPSSSGRVGVMGTLFGFVSALPLLLIFFTVKERKDLSTQEQPKLRSSIRSALRNRPFLFSLGIFIATWVTVDLLQAVLLFYIKYGLKRESSSDIILASIFVTAMAALPLWLWVSKRKGKRFAYIAGIVFLIACLFTIVSLGPATPLALVISIAALSGIGVGAAHVIPWAMIPDSIEWDEWQTGERHEGMFYSLVTLVQKIASSIAVPLVLVIFQFTGYQPNVADQAPAAISGMRLVTGIVPALFLCLGIYFALRYPLTRERHNEIVREIAERRARMEAGG
ncbi:MAG TPA: glycoside-pentoside-hexuronide (GPH):cation symporter [Spirochaetia bacterium]|nr:glycoside-pentoside-hexuronide (GPH):cation symporter [Spirochaetia bacterium]